MADLGRGATGAKPTDGASRVRQSGPSESTGASSAANSDYEQALSAVTVAESKGLLPVGTYRALRERLAEVEEETK